MPNREHGQGYRGSPQDREYEGSTFERDRDDRWRRGDEWERSRDRGEFGGSGEYARGRAGEWSERGYRGGVRDGGARGEWQGRRGERGRIDEYSDYERGRQYGARRSSLGWGDRDDMDLERGERLGTERQRRDWSSRDFNEADEFDYPGESHREYRSTGSSMERGTGSEYGSRLSGSRGEYGSREFGYGETGRYWGGAAAGYGPSTGYGYGTTGSYIGGPEHSGSGRRPEHRQQNFAGRGPRGYKRSDERIREEINERLTRHPDLDASDVDVRVNQCEVILVGVVEDRRAKRLAEDIAEDVWGVDDVRNELKVRRGFLAALTGEQADDREIARSATREGGGGAAGDRSKSARATVSTSTTTPPTGT